MGTCKGFMRAHLLSHPCSVPPALPASLLVRTFHAHCLRVLLSHSLVIPSQPDPGPQYPRGPPPALTLLPSALPTVQLALLSLAACCPLAISLLLILTYLAAPLSPETSAYPANVGNPTDPVVLDTVGKEEGVGARCPACWSPDNPKAPTHLTCSSLPPTSIPAPRTQISSWPIRPSLLLPSKPPDVSTVPLTHPLLLHPARIPRVPHPHQNAP